MFGIGMPEMILILAIALVVLGPKKLPDLAKSLGRAMREFKKATSEFKETMQIESEMADVKKAFDGITDDVKEAVDLKVKPEKKENDQSPDDSADETRDGKKDESAETDDFDNLKNLKAAFDNLEAKSDSSSPDETTPDDKPAADEEKKDKQKGSVDDA
jgi:TatA/E family protein of Tat protein translocase